jgi:hypothetical protein
MQGDSGPVVQTEGREPAGDLPVPPGEGHRERRAFVPRRLPNQLAPLAIERSPPSRPRPRRPLLGVLGLHEAMCQVGPGRHQAERLLRPLDIIEARNLLRLPAFGSRWVSTNVARPRLPRRSWHFIRAQRRMTAVQGRSAGIEERRLDTLRRERCPAARTERLLT